MSAILGETLVVQQADNPNIELVVRGDEFYVLHETKDGFAVTYDRDLGLYCYAILVEGRFESSRTPTTKQPPFGLRRHLRESAEVRKAKFDKRFAQLQPDDSVTDNTIHRTLGPANGLLRGRRVSEGHVLGLTVLVEFQDVEASVNRDDIDDMLNGVNFSLNGNFSSVREYFRLVSSGRFDYENRVVGPIRLSRNKEFYETTLFVSEALEMVVNDLNVDLADFDSRGERIVRSTSCMPDAPSTALAATTTTPASCGRTVRGSA